MYVKKYMAQLSMYRNQPARIKQRNETNQEERDGNQASTFFFKGHSSVQ